MKWHDALKEDPPEIGFYAVKPIRVIAGDIISDMENLYFETIALWNGKWWESDICRRVAFWAYCYFPKDPHERIGVK